MSHSDFNYERIDALCALSARKRVTSNDYSWPIISILSGKKINGFLNEMFGDSDLEDI